MVEITKSVNLRNSVQTLRALREYSSEIEPHENWPMSDSLLREYAWEFSRVMPGQVTEESDLKTKAFIGYIQEVFGENFQIGSIEFGGPGKTLFDSFPMGFFRKTVGVTLDKRFLDQNNIINNHTILEADVFKKETYKRLRNIFGDKGVDLIISKAGGPLDHIASDPAVLGKVISQWYSLLGVKGLMFIQYRFATKDMWISRDKIKKDIREKLIESWADFLRKNFNDTLEIQTSFCSFRLLKKNGAPSRLPLLDQFDQTPVVETRKVDVTSLSR